MKNLTKRPLTLTALLCALSAGAVAHASSVQLIAGDVQSAGGAAVAFLDPDVSGQSIVVPLAVLGGSLPGNLQLAVEPGTLPSGDSVTVNKITTDAQNAYLQVTYNHNPANMNTVSGTYWVDSMPTFDLTSGGKVLAQVWVPVQTYSSVN